PDGEQQSKTDHRSPSSRRERKQQRGGDADREGPAQARGELGQRGLLRPRDPAQAKSAGDPPMTSARKPSMNTPRFGSVANACTEVSTPERTRKVPSSDSEKAAMDSRPVQHLNAPRFSLTA